MVNVSAWVVALTMVWNIVMTVFILVNFFSTIDNSANIMELRHEVFKTSKRRIKE